MGVKMNTVRYVVFNGTHVLGTFRVLEDAKIFADKSVLVMRLHKEHLHDTYIAVVLYNDFRYSAGG
jgi:hypothetical protein